jgi:hypothetical protein
MASRNIGITLGSAVATNGTFTVPYPSDVSSGSFAGGTAHTAFANQTLFKAPTDFTVAFGSSSATVTWKGTTTLAAGTRVELGFAIVGADDPSRHRDPSQRKQVFFLNLMTIGLGSPVAGAANSITTTQALLAATTAGAALSGTTVGILDVPRNVVAAWTGTAVLTVKGKDAFGNALTEVSASGTTFTGKKAFKSVTSITTSADITALTVGTGNVLGLPVALPSVAYVLKEIQDGAVATAGTFVGSATVTPSGTSGDVRGTYVPNATPDGTKAFQLIVAAPAPDDIGVAQYAA